MSTHRKMDDKFHPLDRISTQDDEKKRMLDLTALQIIPPDIGIFDEPTRCYKLNKVWAKIIMGMVSHLTDIAAWKEATNEAYIGCTEVAKFIAQNDDCDDLCTIEILLSDDEFFQEEYIPATLGDWFTNTEAHNAELNAAYDGTPQSIGALIPTGTPNAYERNALCYALTSFVRLYASAKVCVLQSRNFLEIAWDEVRQAVNAVYNLLQQSLAFIYTPNLYSCFVDAIEAIDALQNEAAIQEVGCFLFDELSGIVISEDDFNDALLAAATTLTDDAQKIACLMLNDSNQTVYLNFLEAYNIALQRQVDGDALECPCLTGDYWLFEWSFTNGLGEFTIIEDGSGLIGIQRDDYLDSVLRSGNIEHIFINWNFSTTYEIDQCGLIYDKNCNGGSGNALVCQIFSGLNGTGFLGSPISVGFTGGTANNIVMCVDGHQGANSTHSIRFHVQNELGGTPPSAFSHLRKIRIVGRENGNGKPNGAVWLDAYPDCDEFLP